MKLKPREWGLIVAAVVITGLCWWRAVTPPRSKAMSQIMVEDRRPAPSFELLDKELKRFSLNAYLHRHSILIVFFDRTEDVKSNAILKRLKDVYPVLKSNRIIVCAITNLLPQQVRAGDASQLPFPVLSDVASGQMDSPTVAWGRAAEEPVVSDQSAGIAGGVFYIDRLGLVDWNGNAPRPVDNPQHMINALITGEIQ